MIPSHHGISCGAVVWITGLSAAGKTTLCSAIWDLVKPTLPELVVLDGDIIRASFGHDLTHSEEDRTRQVGRLQGIANVLARQGMVVLVGVLYAREDLLDWNRENLPGYFEVYLKASLETVAARDSKGLYARARANQMPNVVGIDIPWHEPQSPDLVIDQDLGEPPDILARRVIAAVPRLQLAFGKGAA